MATKKIKFNCFSSEHEYLECTIGDLRDIERVLGKSVYKMLADDDFGVDFTLKVFPILYKHCQPKMSPAEMEKKIEDYITGPGMLEHIVGLMIMAIWASGVYSVKSDVPEALEYKDEEPEKK